MSSRWQERAIRVAYFIRVHNVGDTVNPSVITAITGSPVIHISNQHEPHLVAIGSMMAKTAASSHVWGTGVVHPDYGIGAVPSSQVHALRGRLSHSVMRRGGTPVGDVPLGDPAYLAPSLLGIKKNATKKFRVGLVPHYVDRSNPIILRMMREPGVADLNVHDPPEVFLARMAQCEVVVSSSLHGLVFAEALDIPNLWIKVSDDIVGGEFKFQDWFSTTRCPQTSFHPLAGNDTVETLAERAVRHESTIDVEALTAAFPSHRLEEMTFSASRRVVPVCECRARPTPVFLISFNRGEKLKRAIRGIDALTRPTEIIIHDEGSTCPSTLTLLSEIESSGIKVFRYPAIASAEESNRINETVRRYFADWSEPCRYVIADCCADISVADERALDVCDELLDTLTKVECVGPMLRTGYIPRTYPSLNVEQLGQGRPKIIATSFGDIAIVPTTIDATFALHRAGESFRPKKSGLLVSEPFDAVLADLYENGINTGTTFATTSSAQVLNREAELAFSNSCSVRKAEAPALPSPFTSFSSASAGQRCARVNYVEELREAGASDIVRWSQGIHHDPSWAERGAILARMVKPGEAVFEFGAGRSRVRDVLPEQCRYTASDLVPLSDGILQYDLNGPVLAPISGHDVALLSGVLEYVHDLSRAAYFLADNFGSIVCSYAVLGDGSRHEIERRRYSGWFNDFTEDRFTKLFVAAGFTMTGRGTWRAQTLFRFDKAPRA
jgi:hypothetical protein